MGDWSHAVRFSRGLGFAGNINGNAHNRVAVDDDIARCPFTLAFVCGPSTSVGKGNLQAMSSGLFVLRWGGLRDQRGPQRIQAFSGYNGSLLWDRKLESSKGHGLVVVGDHVFLVDGKVLKCLSALNGEVVWHALPNEVSKEMVRWTYFACDSGILVAGLSRKPKGFSTHELVAMNPADRTVLWRGTPASPANAMVIGGQRVFLACCDKSLRAYDLRKGAEVWDVPKAGRGNLRYWPVKNWIMSGSTAYNGSDGQPARRRVRGNLIAGKNYLFGGLSHVKFKKDEAYYVGSFGATDVATGKFLGKKSSFCDPAHPKMITPSSHPILGYVRCYGISGSTHCVFGNYKGLVIGNVDALGDPDAEAFPYYDGICRPDCDTGVIAGNGRVLCPPTGCGCDLSIKRAVALAPMPGEAFRAAVGPEQLEKGEAWGRELPEAPDPEGWPAFRHDSAHSGITPADIKLPLKNKWVSRLSGRLTPPIAAHGKIYVGSSDHSVYCLNMDTGAQVWKYTTGGIVMRSPTWWRGRVYVGSMDGHVYCLRGDNGKLIWRFRGAPHHRYMLFLGKPRSVWPVSGGVVLEDGIAYFYAGLATGDRVFTYALKARTGEIVWGHDKAGRAVEFMPTKKVKGYTVALTGASPFGMTPWGTLAANGDTLFIPQGLRPPGGIDRKTGKIKWFAYRGDSQQRSNFHLQWRPGLTNTAGGTTVALGGKKYVFAGGVNELAGLGQPYKVYLQENGRQLHQDNPALFKREKGKSYFRNPKEGPSFGKSTGNFWGYRSLDAGWGEAPVLDTNASDKYPEGLLYRTNKGIYDFAGFRSALVWERRLEKSKVADLAKGSVIVAAHHYVVAGGRSLYTIYDRRSFAKRQTLKPKEQKGSCVRDGVAFANGHLIASTRGGCIVCFGPGAAGR